MALEISDLRNMTKDELMLKMTSLKADLFNLQSQARTGRIEKPHKIKEVKRDIARINTILKEVESKNATGTQKT